MKKIIVLLVIIVIISFTPKDYASTNRAEGSYTFPDIESYLTSVNNIDDAYDVLNLAETLNIINDEYYNKAFSIVALYYKSNNLNYSNYRKQVFMDSIFSKDNIRYALIEQHKYGIPASVTLAQAYLESKKNGKYEFSNHVSHTNNYFGIKYQKNELVSDKYYTYTQEEFTQKELNRVKKKYKYKVLYKVGNKYRVRLKDSFAVFKGQDAAQKSFRMHSKILHKYQINDSTYYGWTKGLVDNGYATGTGYAQLLNKIIQEYDLHELDYYVN